MNKEVTLLNATAHKRMILSIVSDFDLTRSICELIDNALDIWIKSQRKKNLEIKIDFDSIQNTITITDNAGGVAEKDLEYLISPGGTTNNTFDSTIGIFGVGTKRAVIALSEDIKITTRHKKNKTFALRFDTLWLKDEDWHLPYYQVDNINEDTTLIELQKLRIGIQKKRYQDTRRKLSFNLCKIFNNRCSSY